MPRVTLDIDAAILQELHLLRSQTGKPLGKVVSGLLTNALKQRRDANREPFRWIARDLGARIDLADKEALYARLDEGS
jgi:hypothetical protein